MKPPALWPAIAIGWAIAALVLTLVSAPAIAHLWFPDPDDAMRLLQVRDWLNGQSWWDVSQHRLNGGVFAMHWSRLVDLPIAAVMLLCDPLFGVDMSNRIALTIVPLLTLLVVMALGAELTRRLSDVPRARLAILLAPLSAALLYQLRPLRIDHHGWQVACALLATVALLGRPTARSGAVIGGALAVLLTISLEGMPITAAIAGVAILWWVVDSTRRAQTLAMLATLLGGVVLLHVATRGPGMFAPACDAIAPVWIAAIAIAALGGMATVALSPPTRIARLALLGLAGAGALAALLIIDPACAHGPFASLDPLVQRYWYEKVSEGLPIWEQVPVWAIITIAFPIVGLIGTTMACREATGEARARWLAMLALASASFALTLLVLRAGATANALALPGGAWLLQRMLTPARAISAPLPRIAATAGAFIAATPGIVASAFGALLPPSTPAVGGPGTAHAATVRACDHGHEMADLRQLPTATLFAPIDMTPALLAWTPHRAIAGGYHRNATAIHEVIATFIGTPEAARHMIVASGARYVVGCPGENEMELYKATAPNGFWARLERGDRFDWLQPVPIAGSPVLAWRVNDRARDR